MNNRGRRAVAALWSVQGVGPVTIAALEREHGPLEGLLEVPVSNWVDPNILTAQAQRELADATTLAHIADGLERRAARLGQEIVFPGDAAWPAGVEARARVLFMQGPGASRGPHRRAAIVGTRRASPPECGRIRSLASDLARLGVGIISGAAEGIDQAAHLGALDVGGETWAFVGSALDQLDAPQRRLVAPFFEKDGTFFSQYPPGTRADHSTFVRRNPLIAAASRVVVVARAPATSGALHTAKAALDLNLPLLAVPGDPWNPAAAGSNRLLKKGLARPCVAAEDVLEALGFVGVVSRVPAATPIAHDSLSAPARTVLRVLDDYSCDVDTLCAKTSLAAGDITASLTELELEGLAVQRGGGLWERV